MKKMFDIFIMCIRTTTTCYYIPITRAKIKYSNNIKHWQRRGETRSLIHITGGNIRKMVQALCRTVSQFLIKLNTRLHTTVLLDICSRKMKTGSYKNL